MSQDNGYHTQHHTPLSGSLIVCPCFSMGGQGGGKPPSFPPPLVQMSWDLMDDCSQPGQTAVPDGQIANLAPARFAIWPSGTAVASLATHTTLSGYLRDTWATPSCFKYLYAILIKYLYAI